MTWNAVTPNYFIALARYWTKQQWPLRPPVLDVLLAEAGFSRQDGRYRTGLPVNQPALAVIMTNEQDGLDLISLCLTDTQPDPSPEWDTFINDAYTSYVFAGTKLWGKPALSRSDVASKARWDLSNGCRLEVAHQRLMVGMSLLSPGYAEALRHL